MRRIACSNSIFVVAIALLSACTTNRYAATNKIYTQQVKEAAEAIQQPLPVPETPPAPKELPTEAEVVPPVSLPPSPGHASPHVLGDAKGLREDVDWVGAIHFDLRKPNYVIIHHTAQDSVEQTIRTFTLPHTKVSSHYVISRDGRVYQMLNDYLRGWHAGASKWGSLTDLNSVSIGIELDNNGKEPFPDAQINSLLTLLDTLKANYNIPTPNFLGHGDVSPGRKVDPSVHFPWERLAAYGFGLWPDEVLVTPPEGFNPVDALRIIGYDTSNLPAAIVAFKRRYIQNDLTPTLTLYDESVLYNLYLKH